MKLNDDNLIEMSPCCVSDKIFLLAGSMPPIHGTMDRKEMSLSMWCGTFLFNANQTTATKHNECPSALESECSFLP